MTYKQAFEAMHTMEKIEYATVFQEIPTEVIKASNTFDSIFGKILYAHRQKWDDVYIGLNMPITDEIILQLIQLNYKIKEIFYPGTPTPFVVNISW